MKTLKLIILLLATAVVWQQGKAQCAAFTSWQTSPNSDTVVIDPYVYSGTTDSALATWTIDFGDGQTQSVYGRTWHTYNATGMFNICLTYTSGLCTGTYCDSIYVQSCGGLGALDVSQSTTAGVTSLSVNGAPTGSTYNWTLGSGVTPSTSTSANPLVTYPAGGNYYGYVQVTAPGGCSQYANFNVNTQGACWAGWNKQQYGNEVNFSAAAYHSGATYTWSFGDGQTATGTSASHSYATFGTYTVCLKVVTAGCVDSVCQTVVTAQPVCPDSLFTTTTEANGIVNFTYAVTDSAMLYGSTITTIDYGDGQSSGMNYWHSHQYYTSGDYVACATFVNNYCNVSQCDTIAIDLCNVSSAIGTTGYGSSINYYLVNANPSWTYQWSFPGGTPATSTNSTELVSYALPGSYSAFVEIAIPGCSSTDTFSAITSVSHDSCNANFSYYTNGSTVYLYPQDSMQVVNGNAFFRYGDGTTGNSFSHTYTVAGTYNVRFVVYTSYCADSITYAITITGAADTCNADFGYSANGLDVQVNPFDPTHTSYITYDGVGSSSTSHTFTTYGSHTICHVVWTGTCGDTVCKQVMLYEPYVTVTGTITKQGAGAACDATVLLISDSLGFLSLVDSFSIVDSGACTGFYTFIVPEGNYYLKARLLGTDPDYAAYLPTYYGDEINWADATPVTAFGTNGPWDIALVAGTNPGGPGFVGGWVSEGAGFGVIGNNDHRAVGDPLANIQINLLTDNDAPVAYTYSDGTGRYTFNNLALGSYKIYAEEISKTPLPQIVTLTANNPSQDNIDVLINSNNAVTGINDISDIKLDGVFPNPVKDIATIRFTAKQTAQATIELTNVDGRVLSTTTTNVSSGNNEVKVDVSNYAAGVYTLSITNNDNKKVVKLLKAN